MQKGIIIFDFDDVLVDFSMLMYKYTMLNWDVFSEFFYDPKVNENKDLMSRKLFRINEWLILDKYKNYTPEQYSALQLRIMEIYKNTFFIEDIYSKAKTTKLAKSTLLNPVYVNSPSIEKIIILSRNVTQEQDNSKKKFIETYFNHPKIEYVSISGKTTKAEYIKKNLKNFNLLVDDELSNITEIIDSLDEEDNKKEFLIPAFGYNTAAATLLKAAAESKGCTLNYYDPFD